MEKLTEFTFKGETLLAQFQESLEVTRGVVCDVYVHPETNERDLGVINIQPGCKTPLQRVIGGDETIEGFISGKGKLTITHSDLETPPTVYEVDEISGEGFACIVEVGDTMQWEASADSELVAYEICYPPYKDGRYENLPE